METDDVVNVASPMKKAMAALAAIVALSACAERPEQVARVVPVAQRVCPLYGYPDPTTEAAQIALADCVASEARLALMGEAALANMVAQGLVSYTVGAGVARIPQQVEHHW